MARKQAPKADGNLANKFADAILNFVGHIPKTGERKSRSPMASAKSIASTAAAKAALAAGTLALPPGPLGWLTILPELIAVWKIQAQMVADIAAIYGRKAALGREQMLYCLFHHLAAQAVRDLMVRVGERFLVRRVSLQVLQRIARQIGIRITQRSIGKGIARWIPFAGALGVAAYAYYDTNHVAATAIELFEGVIEVEAVEVGEKPEKNASADSIRKKRILKTPLTRKNTAQG